MARRHLLSDSPIRQPWGESMAKKARKKAGKKAKPRAAKKAVKKAAKKSGKKSVKKAAPAPLKKKSKPAAKRPARQKPAKAPSIGDRLSSAYHAVVDTVTGTDSLRNKMEKPGTSETQ